VLLVAINVRGNTQNSHHTNRMYKNTNADELRKIQMNVTRKTKKIIARVTPPPH